MSIQYNNNAYAKPSCLLQYFKQHAAQTEWADFRKTQVFSRLSPAMPLPGQMGWAGSRRSLRLGTGLIHAHAIGDSTEQTGWCVWIQPAADPSRWPNGRRGGSPWVGLRSAETAPFFSRTVCGAALWGRLPRCRQNLIRARNMVYSNILHIQVKWYLNLHMVVVGGSSWFKSAFDFRSQWFYQMESAWLCKW